LAFVRKDVMKDDLALNQRIVGLQLRGRFSEESDWELRESALVA
jgi:hypothetical protein